MLRTGVSVGQAFRVAEQGQVPTLGHDWVLGVPGQLPVTNPWDRCPAIAPTCTVDYLSYCCIAMHVDRPVAGQDGVLQFDFVSS